MGYDYDKAAELINSSGLDLNDSRMKEALARYESQKAALVPADMNAVTHIFFHSLIMDTSKAFDGDSDSANYNSVMTTKDEFLKILEDMYQKGYVLVRIHDVAYEAPDENGNVRFVKGSVMLPEGKKPFVMSQDDVCYYDYMKGDGFATRIVSSSFMLSLSFFQTYVSSYHSTSRYAMQIRFSAVFSYFNKFYDNR